MSVWVLVVLLFTHQGGISDYKIFKDKESCQAAQVQVTQGAIAQGVQKGSLVCTEMKVGSFT